MRHRIAKNKGNWQYISQSVSPSKRAIRTTTQRTLPAERKHSPDVGVTTVWRSALAVFILHAPAILLITSVCIAGPAVLCLLIYMTLGLETFVHLGGPLSTWEAIITLRTNSSDAMIIALVVQIGLSAIGLVFARGVITRLALSDTRDAPSLSLACRETKMHFLSLLIGSLLYGACIAVGAVGINAALRDNTLDLRHVGRRDVTTPAQALALRMLDAFVPSPGSPFAEFVPLLRHTSFTETTRFASATRSSVPNRYWSYIYDQAQESSENASPPAKGSDTPILAISLVSLGMLLLAEALLRFIPIMTMNARECTRFGAITPVLRSIGLGIRHFGAITKHVWLLRLTFVAGYSILYLLPVTLSQDILPPVMTNAWKSVVGSWPIMLMLMCHWLITALFVAFSAVYDVRLAICLTQDSPLAAHRAR